MKNLSDLKQEFMSSNKVIQYGWDGGHCYSYIKNLPDVRHLSPDDEDDFQIFTDEWLSENDDCPPCQINVKEEIVSSGCGCHDHLDYTEDREEVESIINQLQNYEE